MGIYIPGMKLPPNVEGCEIIIRIQPDGTLLNAQKIHLGMKAIELPPHGRLIDADELCEGRVSNDTVVIHAKTADTIIPASGGENE